MYNSIKMVTEKGLTLIWLIQLQNLILLQLSKSADHLIKPVTVTSSLINAAECNSLKDWVSFVRLFSHKSLISAKSNSASLKNYFGILYVLPNYC